MPQGILDKIDRVLERISNFFAVLSGVLVLIMAFTATYGVIRRYAFKSPEPYSYELSTIFLLWTFVLALAYLEKLDGHLRTEQNMSPNRGPVTLSRKSLIFSGSSTTKKSTLR